MSLIDNYGNAPLHYLIDTFIIECNKNDFYSQDNYSIVNKHSSNTITTTNTTTNTPISDKTDFTRKNS